MPGHPLVGRAHELDELIRKSSDASEQAGTLVPEVAEAIRDAGLFAALVPAELGGEGVDLMTALEVIEIVSRADGSTGWVLMANGTGTAAVAANVGERAADAIFGASGGRAVTAGMLGPGGKCVPVEGGYVGSGSYHFGSGAGHAEWIGAGMLVVEGDALRKLPDGRVEVRAMVVPRGQVVFTGNWDVAGLAGTGSFDYTVPEQRIDDDFSFEVSCTEPRRGGRLFEVGIFGLASLGHGAVALGITARALEEVANLVPGKKRIGYGGPIGDHALFRHEFTHNEAMYQAARAYLIQTFGEAQRILDGDEPLPDELRHRFRQALTYVHRVGAEVVAWCYRWAGTDALRNPHPLGRCLRDMNGATQHLFVDPMTYVDAAPALMRSWQRDRG